jgi:PIN domain-containing protein
MTKHLLVDLENVQPSAQAVQKWMGANGKAWIFYGPHQQKLLPSFSDLGEAVTLIPISRPGANSLDFHLVFYLGYLAAGHPKSEFTVLAKDTGYDPAITHARLLKFVVKRVKAIGTLGASADKIAKATKEQAVIVKLTAKAAAGKMAAPAGKQVPGSKSKKKAVSKAVAAKPTEHADVSGQRGSPNTKNGPSESRLIPRTPVTPAQQLKTRARPVIAIYRDILTDLRGPNRPRSLAALERHIQSRIGEPAPEKVQTVVDRLRTTDSIRIVSGRLTYFPAD